MYCDQLIVINSHSLCKCWIYTEDVLLEGLGNLGWQFPFPRKLYYFLVNALCRELPEHVCNVN